MITIGELKLLNTKLVNRFGGAGIRFKDVNLAISAIDSLDQEVFGRVLYPTVEDKISHLVFSIIANHVFVDGNKRTGTAVLVLLTQQYCKINSTTDELIELALGVAKSEIDREGIKDWIIKHKISTIRKSNSF